MWLLVNIKELKKMKLFEKVKKSKNKIIEDAYIDFLEFNEKDKRTEQILINQIEHSIYVAQCDYDEWGNDGNYSIQCINGAKKFLKSII